MTIPNPTFLYDEKCTRPQLDEEVWGNSTFRFEDKQNLVANYFKNYHQLWYLMTNIT